VPLKKVKITGNINEHGKEWSVDLSSVTGNIPIPYLWARERIKEIEGGEALASGSKQVERKQLKIKQEIIDLSKKYGVVSKETSFVAVESRTNAEKSTGEIVLRKIPVMLTQGWHGIVFNQSNILFDLTPAKRTTHLLMQTRRSEEELSAPSFMRQSRVIFGRRQPLPNSRQTGPSYKPVPPSPNSNIISDGGTVPGSSDRDDLLMQILSLQQAEGGFKFTKAIAKLLNLSFDAMKEAANRLVMNRETDKIILISTAVILTILQDRFTKEEHFWRPVVRKSETWFIAELASVVPKIDGKAITDWAKEFTRLNH
jgi:hypothetical protein